MQRDLLEGCPWLHAQSDVRLNRWSDACLTDAASFVAKHTLGARPAFLSALWCVVVRRRCSLLHKMVLRASAFTSASSGQHHNVLDPWSFADTSSCPQRWRPAPGRPGESLQQCLRHLRTHSTQRDVTKAQAPRKVGRGHLASQSVEQQADSVHCLYTVHSCPHCIKHQ